MILSKLKHNMNSIETERITMNVNNTLIKHKLGFHFKLGIV